MTHYTYDTEFHERGPEHPIQFISIGIVADDGRELYAISSEFDQAAAWGHPFLREHVLPHLPWVTPARGTRGGRHPRLDLDHPYVHTRAKIARLIEQFLDDGASEPVLWADYAAYDHVVLAQLWGTMVDLPTTVPMYTQELRQEIRRCRSERRPVPESQVSDHHPLYEARAAMEQLHRMGAVPGVVCPENRVLWRANQAVSTLNALVEDLDQITLAETTHWQRDLWRRLGSSAADLRDHLAGAAR